MDYRLDISRKHLDFYISGRWIKVKQHTGNTYHEAYSYCFYIYTDMNIELLRKLFVFWT